jgi:hypothetical protein
MPVNTTLLPLLSETAVVPRPTWRPPGAEVVEEKATFSDCLYAFLLGLGTRLQVRLIGYLPFSEIAILLLFPVCFPAIQKSGSIRKTGWCIPLLFVWLTSLLVSDLVRQTNWSLSARGIARIAVLLTALPFLTWFFRRCCYEKILWWLIGVIPSLFLSGYIFRGGVHEGRELVYGQAEMSFETHWGAVYTMPLIVFGFWVYQRSHLIAYAIGIAMGAFNIANGIRSGGAMMMIGPVLTAAVNVLRGRRRQTRAGVASRIAVWKIVVLAGVGLAAVYGVTTWYKSAAAAGQFGERARAKYMAQSRNRFGLLIGGRPEVAAGLLAVSESPIIGYGSWPLDQSGFFERACDIMNVKLDPFYYKKGFPLIPSHSHIVQSWVESGVAATFFWIYVITVLVRAIYLPIKDEKRLRLHVTAGAFGTIWPIFFSPISNRIELSFLLAVIFNQVLFRGLQSASNSQAQAGQAASKAEPRA